MVFEALVVEFLNKFLKQYVENLDTSQLKIGIWGGDVVLNDLKIKSTLFEDFDLPVMVKWGRLGKFAMKIPWKNLYSSQVVIDIEGLLMVIIPHVEYTYDPVKEEKWAQERKQAKIKAVEEAKKRDMETESNKQNDSFLEKLLTQITKNLQIVIRNIHIRYEDKTTVPGAPFTVGVTLSNLSAQTTNTDPTKMFPKLLQDVENLICKIVNLDGLAIYWNSSSTLFSEMPDDSLIDVMLSSIPTVTYRPQGFTYMFGPLSASAFLRLNPKPELDGSNFMIPKTFVNVHLKEIDLAVTHSQFCEAMLFLQDYQRQMAAAKYKKYRPVATPIFGNARIWWQFAYTAVMEDIIRRKKEWCWENIKEHRKMCRRYLELFKMKLYSKKLSPAETSEITFLEKKLNVFNLILIREQVYVEVERNKEILKEGRSRGWLFGWFGSGGESKPDLNDDELVKKLQSVMTTKEKQKLYKAIGYEESAPPTNYPTSFVQVQFWLHLDEMKLIVYEDPKLDSTPVMTLSVKSVRVEFEQRPSAFAQKFVMIIGNFQVTGKAEKGKTQQPELVTSNCKESESLIELVYETKPLDSACDQRVIVNARPLSIIFHANTINLLRNIFTTVTTGEVEKIVAATSASLPTFRSITSMGLQYAIEKRTVLEVKINIKSSYLIIPYGGVYHPDKDMLVLMLGSLSIESEDELHRDVSVRKLFLEGTTNEEIFSTVLSASYTNFKCLLTGVQVLFQLSGEDWVAASKMRRSCMQFLEPTNLEVTIKKSLVTDDARIPKIIVEGKLPSLTFNFSEARFVNFVALACSIPTEPDPPTSLTRKGFSVSSWSTQSFSGLENALVHKAQPTAVRSAEYLQGIDLVGHFEMNELKVNVSKSVKYEVAEKYVDSKGSGLEEQFLNLRLVKLEIELTIKTFETIHLFKLGGIDFKQYLKKNWLPFVSTRGLENDYYLFVAEYIKLDTKIPDFYSKRSGIANRLTLNITPLNVLLEKEALLAQIAFVTNVQRRVDCVRESSNSNRAADAARAKDTFFDEWGEVFHNDKKILTKGKRFRRKSSQQEVIDFFLQVSLDEIIIGLEFRGEGLAQFNLNGGSIDISSRKSYATVDVNIREVSVLDLNTNSLHKKILASLESKTLSSRVTIYNKEYFGSENTMDLSIDAEVGGIQVICLSLFFSRALTFLNAFQTQVESLKEGASIAAQKAKQNVVKAFHNAAQICLNINITAPLLLIPKASTSNEVLGLDLGVLSIKNSFTELDYAPDGRTSSRPLIDTVKINLHNLKVLRSADINVKEIEKTFLVPVTFELTIKRNLSTAWFRVIPELEIMARLATVRVTLTHEDLCGILSIVQENLAEGEQDSKIDKAISRQRMDHKHPQKPRAQSTGSRGDVPTEEDERGPGLNFTVVKFEFFMESFIFDALNEKREFTSENTGLARFVLEAMSLRGRLFSDGAMSTSMMLVSCILEDTRPGKEGRLTRLMERTEDPSPTQAERQQTQPDGSKQDSNLPHSMVEVIYQNKDLDSFVDIRVYRFTLALSMDFLQKLKIFFTLDDDQTGMEIKEATREHIKAAERRFSVLEEAEDRPPTFTLNLRLEKPDIIFVENMDSINTDALIFHAEMVMKYRVSGRRQIVSGTLHDIELYSCCFNPVKRPHTLSQVVKPFSVSIAGSTPEGSGLHVDICLTEILISINPSTVDLISKCYEALVKDTFIKGPEHEDKVLSDLWDIHPFSEEDYLFLKTEIGEEALRSLKSSASLAILDPDIDEICLLAIPSITVYLEGTSAASWHPLLLLEMGFQLRCYNWSQRMTITSSLTLEMRYYNKTCSAWEPLIESLEKYSDQNKAKQTPWELMCNISFEDEGELDAMSPPKVQVTFFCEDVLQMTFTKSCVEVLKTVLSTFTTAVTKHEVKKYVGLPPYIVKNETGLTIELMLKESKLQVCKTPYIDYTSVKLDTQSEVELQNENLNRVPELHRHGSLPNIKKDTKLVVKMPTVRDEMFELPVGLSSKRYFPFSGGQTGREVWGLVSEVFVVDQSTTIVLRTFLKIHNHFNQPINIHFLTGDGIVAEFVGTVEGNSSFSVPYSVCYKPDNKFFFSANGYTLSTEPFPWETLRKEFSLSVLLQCANKAPESHDPFFIQAVGEAEQIYYANSNRKTMSSLIFKIHLQPTVKIFNSLPVPLEVCCQGKRANERTLHPGNQTHLINVEPGTSTVTLRAAHVAAVLCEWFKRKTDSSTTILYRHLTRTPLAWTESSPKPIGDYLEKEWSCKEVIPKDPPEFLIWKFLSYNGLASEKLNLGVHVTHSRRTAVYTVYSPYFMINKTGLLLSYKFEQIPIVFYHPGHLHLPVLFSPSSKKFYGKKFATLQVEQSVWSDKFPVDVAGSGGTVECRTEESGGVYRISVNITLTYNSLTKIVVFTPFFVLVNTLDFNLLCTECTAPGDEFLEIPSNSYLPFWPQSKESDKTICIKPKNSEALSPAFDYHNTDNCLLKLSHECGGIFVNIKATQSGTCITFRPYEVGQAPSLIINNTTKVVKLYEAGTDYCLTLLPSQKVLHAWVRPTGPRMMIFLNSNQTKEEIPLDQDVCGVVLVTKEEGVQYTSFLHGRQRVLLFSEDQGLLFTLSSIKLTISGIEVICKIHGVGISLVNNLSQVEILYLEFLSSGVSWETKKHGKTRFKPMKLEDASQVENAYQLYLEDRDTKKVKNVVTLHEKFVVDFDKMEVVKPTLKFLKRTFDPGLWFALRKVGHQTLIHLKINKIQIDSQLYESTFPVVLAVVPPPKTVAHQDRKPFFELSVVRVRDEKGVQQYKYCKTLIQEFHVKIDLAFVQQLYMFLAAEEMSDEEHRINFKKDLEFTQKPLIDHIEVVSLNEQKTFFGLLHFPPLKIHFSFSLAGKLESNYNLPPAMGVLLQSLGVTLTDIHDVVFRLSYLERKGVFLTRNEFKNEVVSHYFGQIIRQAYVLLFGLDVIGNPYGLIVGIGEGVEAFFYEPFQGMIQGPSEFGKGMAIGCRSLFGHTVASAAGTLGKLTETLGKGLAVLSLDKEYQMQRMAEQNRQDNIQASMARGGRGLVMGVVEGVSGVVQKPIQGAKEEGVGGFFKGVGKGLMGLMTRPVTGVVDFASTSLNAVKRATALSAENKRMRPPRYFRDDDIVGPYNLREAEGNLIFHAINKGKYSSTDKYEYHLYLREKEIVLLTNKRIIMAEHSDVFGTWQEHMAITWKSMPDRPRCHTKGVALTMPPRSGQAKDKPDVKVLLIEEDLVKKAMCKRMQEFYQMEKERKDSVSL